MPRLRVLLLLHELSRTGAPRIALDALDAMRGEVEVRIIVPAAGPLEAECRAIGPLDILSEKWPRGRIWRRIYGRYLWRRWLRGLHRWAPDVIYVNSISALPILESTPLPEAPVLLHVHELHTLLRWIMVESGDLLVRRPARYLAASDAVLHALMAECGIDRDRIAVIHEFIPEQRITDAIRSRAEGPHVDTLVVGGAGLPQWRKGTTLWLQMAAEVRRLVGRTVRFVWVGAPEYPHPNWLEGVLFRRMVQLMELDDVVEIIPSTPRPLEHFARFDIFAMTSWEDPCPLVVLENMGIGTPVVCFAGGGGAPEVVGDTGVIIPDFDPRAMAQAIAALAADPAELARLGDSARRRMLANYTDRAQVPKIRRELMALAGDHAARSVRPGIERSVSPYPLDTSGALSPGDAEPNLGQGPQATASYREH